MAFTQILKVLYQTCTNELIETLLRRSFKLCYSYENFHRETESLKSIFKNNNYPQIFLNQYIKSFLNKLFIKKTLNFIVLKRELTSLLPYLGKLSLDLRTRRYIVNWNYYLPYCQLKVIFKSKCRLNTLSRFKDLLDKKIRSGMTYCYMCSNCKVTYYGKTFRHFYTRVAQHIKGDKGDKPILNRTKKLFPLELFDWDDNFISSITWLPDFLLLYNSNFILCADKTRICFKCYVKENRKCSFENALAEKSETSTN